ncbi:MAG TPA: prepilin-type N-terminal cleavage/methylation domain-containing protein [Candidatus Acidoferrales bacterium]|nr:prepilin-type N-terminal cleavage/methylation domain-containing protein [Candidatus Acidoferrales bacterium]
MLTKVELRLRRAGSVQGFSLIELLIVIAIILIIAAIAIPNYLRSKMAANEASAVEHVRAIGTAATVYNTSWNNGYPASLPTLGGVGATATCTQAILLDSLITSPPFAKSGYIFSYQGVGSNTPVVPGCPAGFYSYLTTAVPITLGSSGQRSFCSDLPGAIHFDITGAAITSAAQCDALPTL